MLEVCDGENITQYLHRNMPDGCRHVCVTVLNEIKPPLLVLIAQHKMFENGALLVDCQSQRGDY